MFCVIFAIQRAEKPFYSPVYEPFLQYYIAKKKSLSISLPVHSFSRWLDEELRNEISGDQVYFKTLQIKKSL